jgi:2-aminoethylphosphonate-pyruvate transaminase
MKTFLLNAGPTNVSDEVAQALLCGNISHNDKNFSEVLLRVNSNIVKSLKIDMEYSSVMFATSGTGCNEAVIASIYGKILLLESGKYSHRIMCMVRKYGIPMVALKFSFANYDLNSIENALKNNTEISHIVLVHHETLEAALAPIEQICALANKYNKLIVVDTVSSLFGLAIDISALNIAFCTVSANKCLESFPGVSFVIGKTSEIMKLKNKSKSCYLDLYEHWKKEQSGAVPFTMPVQLVYAVDKAVELFMREGWKNRILRYAKLSAQLRIGMEKMGFSLTFLPEGVQSDIVTFVLIPKGFDYWTFHELLRKKGVFLYPDVEAAQRLRFRITVMGCLVESDIKVILARIREVLIKLNYVNGVIT